MAIPLRVLIVEDSEDDALLLVRELKKGGFEPEWYRVDAEAAFLDHLDPTLNVILSDYRMPAFDGLRALEILKQRLMDVPFIIVSGTIGEDLAVQAIKFGASDYLLKDRIARLCPAVERALEERRLRAETRLSEQSLRENQTFLSSIVETTPTVLYVFDLADRRFTYANNRLVKILGYAPEWLVELGREALPRLLNPEDVGLFEDHLARLAKAATGEVLETEVRLLHDNGEWRWFLFAATVLQRDQRGQAVLILGSALDVTERHAASQQLKAVLEGMPDGVVVVNASGRIIIVNGQAEALFGYARDEILGRPVEVLLPDQVRKSHAGLREAYLSGPVTRPMGSGLDLSGRRKDGSAIPVEISLSPLQSSGEAAVISVIRDISERRALERQLQHARSLETIGLIAGGVAHEVRNPLFAISAIVAALEKKLHDQPEFGEYVTHVQEQTSLLNGLMNDLLTLGKPVEASAFAPCVLQDLVEGAHKQLAAGTTSVRDWAMDAPVEPIFVSGISDKLIQVFQNIAGNANAFSPEGHPIRIRMRQEGKTACVAISDSGPGILENMLPRLFEPFASKRKGGTGLGLAIVQRIVEAHSGTVEAANNDPPPGATFTVRLPILED